MLISPDRPPTDTASRLRRAEGRRPLPPAAPQMAGGALVSCAIRPFSSFVSAVEGQAREMKHGSVTRSVQFRSPVQGLAASLLLLAGVLIVNDGLRRPWDLRGRFADTVAAAAEEQQHREQHSAAAALAAAATERPNQEQQAGQQLGLAGLPPEQLGAFAGQQEAPPPPLPPPHQHDVQRQQADEQQQEEPQHAAQHTEQQGQQQQEAQQDEEQQGAQQQQQQQAAPTAAEPPRHGQDDATVAFCIAVKGALSWLHCI